MIFRDADVADAPMLAALARDTFTETFGHLYSQANLAAFLAGHRTADWAAVLADPAWRVRLGEVDGRAAAYARVGPPTLPVKPSGPAAELRQFYIRRPWQGSGHAATLMAWVIDTARDLGAHELFLSVFIDNHRARRFYTRYGFEEIGRYAFMVGDHADEDIVMRRTL